MNNPVIEKNTSEHDMVDDKPFTEIGKITEIESKRKYDIIVFGASGFTGQFIVMEMARFCQIYNLTWAVAGRNSNKLEHVLEKMYEAYSKLFVFLNFYLLYSW